MTILRLVQMKFEKEDRSRVTAAAVFFVLTDLFHAVHETHLRFCAKELLFTNAFYYTPNSFLCSRSLEAYLIQSYSSGDIARLHRYPTLWSLIFLLLFCTVSVIYLYRLNYAISVIIKYNTFIAIRQMIYVAPET